MVSAHLVDPYLHGTRATSQFREVSSIQFQTIDTRTQRRKQRRLLSLNTSLKNRFAVNVEPAVTDLFIGSMAAAAIVSRILCFGSAFHFLLNAFPAAQECFPSRPG